MQACAAAFFACVVAFFGFAAAPAFAQGRTAVSVAAVTLSPTSQTAAASNPGFAETVRTEIQTALQGTGLFTVTGANGNEIDAMVAELARSGRAAPRRVAAQYVYAVQVETLTLNDELRVAPQMSTHDLVSTRGSIGLQISVLSPSTGDIVRFAVDSVYRPAPVIRDAMSTRNTHAVNRAAVTRPSQDPQAYRALAHAVAARLAGRLLENNNAVQVVDVQDGRVFLNRGEDAGYVVGDILNVRTLGRELRDPITGERLGDTGGDIGRIRIVEVRPRLSVAVIEEGAGAIGVGAIIRRRQDSP